MAASVHDTIRLSYNPLVGGMPDAEYHVAAEGLMDNNYAAVVAERSLTGLLHVHRATSGGLLMQFRDYLYIMILTHAEYRTLRGLVGHICYFMPHYRDEAAPANYLYTVLVHPLAEEVPLDPMLTWWRTTLKMTDAASNTVG